MPKQRLMRVSLILFHLSISKLTRSRSVPATLLKKRLWHRCFPVNFAKFLRTPFFTEHLWWLPVQIFEPVASSLCQTKPTHSSTISSLTASYSNGSNSSEAIRFKPVKPQLTDIHIKQVRRNVEHFQLENNHPSSSNVINTSPTVAYDHTTHDSNNITSCNQITQQNLFSSKGIQNCEVVDKCIDDLIKGSETKLPVSRHFVNVNFVIQQENESRQLPPLILHHFRGNPVE